MMILQGITRQRKSKGKNVLILLMLLSVLILIPGCSDKTELFTQNEVSYIRCGKAAGTLCNIFNNIDITTLKPGNENLRRILRSGIYREFAIWWRPKKTYFYCQFFKGTWEVIEYVDHGIDWVDGEWGEEEEAAQQAHIKESMKYNIGRQFTLDEENTFEVTPGGFIYDYEDLLATVRVPSTLGIEPLCVGAIVSLEGWEQKGSNALFLFIDGNGKAYFVIDGCFFLVERIEERISNNELYLWQEWADRDRPWDPYY